jgi:hypothetical protein
MNEWMGRWVGGWTAGRTDGRTCINLMSTVKYTDVETIFSTPSSNFSDQIFIYLPRNNYYVYNQYPYVTDITSSLLSRIAPCSPHLFPSFPHSATLFARNLGNPSVFLQNLVEFCELLFTLHIAPYHTQCGRILCDDAFFKISHNSKLAYPKTSFETRTLFLPRDSHYFKLCV